MINASTTRIRSARRYARLAVCSLLGEVTHGASVQYSLRNHPEHVVPDAATAVAIAEAVLVPVYGPNILNERPFHARLEGNLWTVSGTQHAPLTRGGVAVVRIHRTDARIRYLGHGR